MLFAACLACLLSLGSATGAAGSRTSLQLASSGVRSRSSSSRSILDGNSDGGRVLSAGRRRRVLDASPAAPPASRGITNVTVVLGDVCWNLAMTHDMSLAEFVALNPAVVCSNLTVGEVLFVYRLPPCSRSVKVVSGDLCYRIAQDAGITLEQLFEYNPYKNCTNLQLGQLVCVAPEGAAPRAVQPLPPSPPPMFPLAPSYPSPPPGHARVVIPVTLTATATCWYLWVEHDMTHYELNQLNPGLDCADLQKGQVVNVYELPQCTKTAVVGPKDSCWSFAQAANITVEELQAYNPFKDCRILLDGQIMCLDPPAGYPLALPPPAPPSQSPVLSPPPPLISAGNPPSGTSGTSLVAIVVSTVVGSVVLASVVSALIMLYRHKRRRANGSGGGAAPSSAVATGSYGIFKRWSHSGSRNSEALSDASMAANRHFLASVGEVMIMADSVKSKSPLWSNDGPDEYNGKGAKLLPPPGSSTITDGSSTLSSSTNTGKTHSSPHHTGLLLDSVGSASGSAAYYENMLEAYRKLAGGLDASGGPGTARIFDAPSGGAPSPFGAAAAALALGVGNQMMPMIQSVRIRENVRLDLDLDTEIVIDQHVKLGEGGTGVVYQGSYQGIQVAIKRLSGILNDEDDVLSFRHELDIMSRLDHPNVVVLYGGCFKPPQVFLVMELLSQSLGTVIAAQRGHPLHMAKVFQLAKDILSGLAYLHALDIIHRDLKPMNILLTADGAAKIGDFGLARGKYKKYLTTRKDVGTCAYMPPECFDDKVSGITSKADVYSFGIMLWEILTMTEPWHDMFHMAIIYQVAVKKERPRFPDSDTERFTPRLRAFIESCWSTAPADRPTSAAALEQLMAIEAEYLEGMSNSTSFGSSHHRIPPGPGLPSGGSVSPFGEAAALAALGTGGDPHVGTLGTVGESTSGTVCGTAAEAHGRTAGGTSSLTH